ncbi:MAG: DedA family protein [Ignavibacteriaceae bacterium]|nr:DedA family protein [Ignavibacteriaceae bacterium]
MEFNIVEIFLHLDKYLDIAIRQYGTLTYAILFFVIFAETGFVFTPFLPGDSLLFAAGTFAAISMLNVHYLFLLLTLAAVLGNSSNYLVGHLIGEKIFHKNSRFLKKEYLDRTHAFYEKHGGKTVIITRFVPIIRTFAPFVAGVGSMTFTRFSFYNIAGGVLWVIVFVYGGYFFGNISFVKNNFSVVTIAIILISLLPAIIEFFRQKRKTVKPEPGN